MSDTARDHLGQLSWTIREYGSRERLRRQGLVARRMQLPALPWRPRRPGEVWGIAMVRDEADVIGTTIDHLLAQGVDRVLVVDNGSVDGTRELLRSRAGHRLLVGDDPVVPYFQAEKMTWLAHRAWRAGADWIVPFDADEWWFAERGSLAEHLRATADSVLYADLHHMVPVQADPSELSTAEFVLDATPGFPGKVAFRAHPLARLDRGNHAVARVGSTARSLRIAHAVYRGPAQVMRKVRQGTAAASLTGDDIAGLTPHWARASVHDDAEIERMWSTISQGMPEPRLGFDAVGPMIHVRPGTWATWDPAGALAAARRAPEAKTVSTRSVSVVVPHYGDPAHGQRLAEQLLAQRGLDDIEVIVVDDGSPLPYPDSDDERVRVVRCEANGGFGSAVNAGAAHAQHPWLLVLNSDVSLARTDVARLVDAAPAGSLVGPSVRTSGGVEAVGRTWPRPTSIGLAKVHILQRFHSRRWYLRAIGVDVRPRPGTTTPVDWVAGVAMLLPTDLFRTVGGFDQRYFMYCEETDLQRRLAEHGAGRFLIGEVEVEHLGGASSDPARVEAWLVASQLAYAHKWGGLAATRAAVAGAALVNLVTDGARRVARRPTQPWVDARRVFASLRSARSVRPR